MKSAQNAIMRCEICCLMVLQDCQYYMHYLLLYFVQYVQRSLEAILKVFLWEYGKFIRQAWGKLYELALWCSQLGDKINQETIALIVHWLIIIIVIGVILGIIAFGVMLLIGNEFTSECKENYMDNVSLTIIFISLGIVVFLGKYIKSVVAINLIGLFFIAIVVYLIVRFIIDKIV